ncbi:MAG: M48 family metallopeptidase [Candidatus Eremiobacteraeota bacterium]|nr:M48 family metallopeptidase [Candidatus Eremiobacteraeota bacterium]
MQVSMPIFRSAAGLERAAPPRAHGAEPEIPQETYVPSPASVAVEPRPRSLFHRSGAGLLAALSLAGGLVGLTGCSPSPPSEGPKTSVSTELTYYYMSTEAEQQLGQRVVANIESKAPLWHNAEAQQRLDQLAARLTPFSLRQDLHYTFKLLDTPEVNAMAAPGGTIYVTRGLYERFHKDEHLLFILGHEMGHVEHRHSIKQLGKATLLDIVVGLTTDSRDNSGTIGRAVEAILNNKISQSDEHEADRTGQAHLIQMGINPWHAVDAMKLLAEGQEAEPAIITEIFGSHPPTAERVAELTKGASGYEPLK